MEVKNPLRELVDKTKAGSIYPLDVFVEMVRDAFSSTHYKITTANEMVDVMWVLFDSGFTEHPPDDPDSIFILGKWYESV